MNLRTIIIGLAAVTSVGFAVAACSSSSTTNNITGTDGGPKADSGGGGGDTDGGGGGDDGGGGGGNCKLADGMYSVDSKATPGSDVDAASPAESASCKDSTSTVTIDSTKDASGGTPAGCTEMASSDGCTNTLDCTTDSNGYKTTSHTVIAIDASGTKFTITTTSKTIQDDGGAALTDCTTVSTATKM